VTVAWILGEEHSREICVGDISWTEKRNIESAWCEGVHSVD